MLSTLLQTLQGLLPKRFFIVSVGPVLIFVLLNGALLYFEDFRFRAFVERYFIERGTLDIENAFFLLLAVLLVAFLYSMLVARLRGWLEGRGGLEIPALLRRQHQKRKKLTDEYARVRLQYDRIASAREGWKRALREARLREDKEGCDYPVEHPASRLIRGLQDRRERGELLEFDELDAATRALEKALRENVVEPKVPGSEQDCDRLNDDHRFAGDLPGYAQSRLSQESTARHSEVTVSFPSDNLAQTTMGNVARSVSSYARQRYGMDLDFMWTRLQKVMEGDDHYRTLMEAQIRVDFVVSMFWLLVFSLVLWIPCYVATGTNPVVFLALTVGTPFVLTALYKLCTESYRAFADLLRSAVDLFRFQLLGELRLPLPEDGAQERRLWTMVNRQMAFGETQNLPYIHDRGSR